MISTNSIIYSFIISTITTLFLKIYEQTNHKEYESGEYVKVFILVLLSSIFTFYIKTLINPLLNKIFGSSSSGGSVVGNQSNNLINGGSSSNINSGMFQAPSTIPGLTPMNLLNPNMNFNMNKPTF